MQELLNVKAAGTYKDHSALKLKTYLTCITGFMQVLDHGNMSMNAQ
jgi:hypothetical protein